MSKNILIISSSLHTGSNTEVLAKECEKGAISVRNQVKFISLKGKNIQFCICCFSCQSTGNASSKMMLQLSWKKCDPWMLSFFTPLSINEMSGQLKTLLDRLNPLFPFEYSFRDIYEKLSANMVLQVPRYSRPNSFVKLSIN